MKKNMVTGGNTKKKCRCISYRRGGYYHNCYSVLIWTWINNIFFSLAKIKILPLIVHPVCIIFKKNMVVLLLPILFKRFSLGFCFAFWLAHTAQNNLKKLQH